jgi:hypothetical protein
MRMRHRKLGDAAQHNNQSDHHEVKEISTRVEAPETSGEGDMAKAIWKISNTKFRPLPPQQSSAVSASAKSIWRIVPATTAGTKGKGSKAPSSLLPLPHPLPQKFEFKFLRMDKSPEGALMQLPPPPHSLPAVLERCILSVNVRHQGHNHISYRWASRMRIVVGVNAIVLIL